jgi:hypothetical protein
MKVIIFSGIRRQTNQAEHYMSQRAGMGVRTAEPQLGMPAEVLWFLLHSETSGATILPA